MTEMSRKEAEEALAQADVDMFDSFDELREELKRLLQYGMSEDIPYCLMSDEDIIEIYEETFDETIVLL